MKSTTQGFRRRTKFGKPLNISEGRRRSKPQRANNRQSLLDPDSLVRKAKPSPEIPVAPGRRFDELNIDARLKERIAAKGYVNLTQIQDQTMEWLISGQDMMGIANTGTGKTGAFLIPVIHRLLTSASFETLILVPTRELALQVEEEFRSFTKGLGLYCTSLIGGTSVHQDMQRLRKTNHVVIGTPGRVIDLMNRNVLKLGSFSTFILDEFDRMLDMGFIDDVTRITEAMKNRKQTMLFSATENKNQKPLIQRLLKQPKEIRVSSGTATAERIDQDIVRISNGQDKFSVLLGMVRQEEFGKVLVFAETKRWVSRLALKLKGAGIRADEIHGNKSQAYRKKALGKFRSGSVQVLVATDVAARGIDVDDVTHVINYQMPQNMDSYVHRIGRTGRAGKAGKAFTLVDSKA